MTFDEVQSISEQIGTIGRSLSLPSRYFPRFISAGTVPFRPKTSVEAMAESVASTSHEFPVASVHFSPPALVAATNYAAQSEQSSDLSAVGSDTSLPTRGRASAAGSVHEEAVSAVNERTRSCYLCFRSGHFLMECTLLGYDAEHAAQWQRVPSSGNHLPPRHCPQRPGRRPVYLTGRPESHPQEDSAMRQ
jgi:hypothetical protein